MGGSTFQDAIDTTKGFTSDAVGATTLGFIDVENGKINTNLKDAKDNFVQSATGGDTIKSLMPQVPDLPKPIEKASLENEAVAKAAAKTEAQKKGGISSTLLGGGVTADNSNLKKKKLLGE